jgi:outer membrane protein TolC
LLRGFGEDVNKTDIYLAQRDRRISLSVFRQQVIKTVADVETAYYQLMLAKANVSVREWLLLQTIETQGKIRKRINIDADKITVSQVEAAVESRNADLIRARTTLRDASDQLKNAINDPDLDIRQNALINPLDMPISEPLAFNVGEQIDLALRQRPEMQQARLQIERADIILKAARNALLPKADLTLSVQSNGLDDSFDSAFGATVNPAHFLSYAAGLSVEIPFGNRNAEAQVRSDELQREQVIMQLVQAAQSIVLDVKQQLRDVLTSYQEIQARVRSRISAANQLEAFTQKQEIVALSPEFLNLKLQAQSQLADAELSEISAVIGYNLAITRLEQAKGTLLEYNRIAIDQPPPAKNNEDFGKIRFLGQTYDLK